MVEEEKQRRVASLGWLTESSIMPKKQKQIEGVGASSILELKAQLYKTQEEAGKSKEFAPDVEFHRTKKTIVPNDAFSRENFGVQSRANRDKLELKAEKDGSTSYAALEKKAEMYEKLSRGELPNEEDKEKYCVDFFSKSLSSEPSVMGKVDEASSPGTSNDCNNVDLDNADILPVLFPTIGPGRTGDAIDKDEHKRFVREVHEEASQARETASAIKLHKQAQAQANRERLKQAHLRKQLEKLKASKATDFPGSKEN